MKTTKQCNSCNKIKTIDNFSIKRSNKDGYFNICKLCKKTNDIIYSRSVDGIITKYYIAHKSRAKKENYELIYTKQQLREWIDNQEHFIELFKEWELHGWSTDYYPSVTKIDNTERYSLDNIKLTKWEDVKLFNSLKPKEIRDAMKIKTVKRLDRKKSIKRYCAYIMKKNIINRTHKVCSECKINKEINEYNNTKYSIDGKVTKCKECDYINQLKFVRTKHGTAYRIYKKQVQKSKLRGHQEPQYTFEELNQWLLNQDIFHKIYDEWVASGYETMMCVSCDRRDRFKGYSFGNIRVTTWQDNFNRWMKHRL